MRQFDPDEVTVEGMLRSLSASFGEPTWHDTRSENRLAAWAEPGMIDERPGVAPHLRVDCEPGARARVGAMTWTDSSGRHFSAGGNSGVERLLGAVEGLALDDRYLSRDPQFYAERCNTETLIAGMETYGTGHIVPYKTHLRLSLHNHGAFSQLYQADRALPEPGGAVVQLFEPVSQHAAQPSAPVTAAPVTAAATELPPGERFDLQQWLAEQSGGHEPPPSGQPSPRLLANDILGVTVGQDLSSAERQAVGQMNPALMAEAVDQGFGGTRLMISADGRRAMSLHYLAGDHGAEPVVVGINLLTLFPSQPPLDRLRQTLVGRYGEAVAELDDGQGRFGLAEGFDPFGHCAAFTTADAESVAWDDLDWVALSGADHAAPEPGNMVVEALLQRPVHAATEVENLELGGMIDCGLTLHAALTESGGQYGFLVGLYDFAEGLNRLTSLAETGDADEFFFSLDPD